MRLLLTCITAIVCGSCSLVQPKIVGKWRCESTESTNIQEFLADGTFISKYELKGDIPRTGENVGKWRIIEGDRLETTGSYGTVLNNYEVVGNRFRYNKNDDRYWCDAVK